ncbi:hypothetical protein [Streptomyces sp. B6B3]|uniref:hypothetical protein n=1 Tax=Streptomyces sp. B6B3 TaxID=3153570 RepID=UPI00325F7CB2
MGALSEEERAGQPPLISLGELCDQVLALVTDDTAAGRVVVFDRGAPPRVLDSE